MKLLLDGLEFVVEYREDAAPEWFPLAAFWNPKDADAYAEQAVTRGQETSSSVEYRIRQTRKFWGSRGSAG